MLLITLRFLFLYFAPNVPHIFIDTQLNVVWHCPATINGNFPEKHNLNAEYVVLKPVYLSVSVVLWASYPYHGWLVLVLLYGIVDILDIDF